MIFPYLVTEETLPDREPRVIHISNDRRAAMDAYDDALKDDPEAIVYFYELSAPLKRRKPSAILQSKYQEP
ncbi:hypothetical protein [Sulfuriroseicoccus oceanibius]|uniref:Uncharacterized protein n=1 Tax=Sulfuriroseicoccus oceanibius TaxID=2707525 RepID=A0A6B3LB55_9BACT|nr:hypothetical protein [Sulfuriroseicoccus oceanibius]QQL44235.1 hypothetical protein G3M56_010050 [Sulfuriroseicoccus oceanibius]